MVSGIISCCRIMVGFLIFSRYVSHVTIDWIVQNVIEVKDQMRFKILLVCSSRTPALRWGALQIPKKGRKGR